MASRGTSLIRRCWGGYVAVLSDAEAGSVDILRAPLGDLACYWTNTESMMLFASDVSLMRAAGMPSPSIDAAALACHLAAEDIRRPETCLAQVNELPGGQRITVEAGRCKQETLWSPWIFAAPERQLPDAREAAHRVRDAALHCVGARAADFSHILLKLSGGLDSSIVFACLHHSKRPFTAVTLATNDPSGDERAHAADARDKANTNKESAAKAIRNAWSHILYPVESASAGKPFDLDHASISGADRQNVPTAAFAKVIADGIAREKLGADTLWLKLKDLWPKDRDYLPIAEVASWFASYVHLPRIKNRTVLELAIRDAVAKLDASFGYADAVDGSNYTGLRISKALPEFLPDGAVLVREAVARDLQAETAGQTVASGGGSQGSPKPSGEVSPEAAQQRPKRFYGSVELDATRPIRSLETIMEAVVAQLQHASGTKVTLTLDVEAVSEEGFSDSDVGVVRDNARQLKFKAESTGFEE